MQTATEFWGSKVLLTAVELDLFSTLPYGFQMSNSKALAPRQVALDAAERPRERSEPLKRFVSLAPGIGKQLVAHHRLFRFGRIVLCQPALAA
jgi:hypothetical protein